MRGPLFKFRRAITVIVSGIFLCLLAAIQLQTFCYADVPKLSADDLKALNNNSHFHKIHAARNLPLPIFALCADYNGRLAEPGHKWEPTDVITNDKLPTSRLIWAFTDGDYYVVHCERGGYAHSYYVLVAKLKADEPKPSLIWRGYVVGRVKDYPAFLKQLQNGKFYVQSNDFH